MASAKAEGVAEKGMLPMPLGGQGTPMKPKDAHPLARSFAHNVLDWDQVDPQGVDFGKDLLGLSAADRQALGLSAPRVTDLQAPTLGGAETALAEALAQGGAWSKDAKRRR